MTEAQWNKCTDLQKMLEFLQGKATDRKLRLFVCHCFSRIRPTYTSERIRRLVQISERYADGLATEKERDAAHARAKREHFAGRGKYGAPTMVAWLSLGPKTRNPSEAARRSAFMVAMDTIDTRYSEPRPGFPLEDPEFKELMELEKSSYQAPILRDIFGNPFRPVTLNPAWLAWNDRIIPKLARAAYDERAFDRLPILADALEEAGCADADILGHCRGPGPHVRGCWVVDLILGKQ